MVLSFFLLFPASAIKSCEQVAGLKQQRNRNKKDQQGAQHQPDKIGMATSVALHNGDRFTSIIEQVRGNRLLSNRKRKLGLKWVNLQEFRQLFPQKKKKNLY